MLPVILFHAGSTFFSGGYVGIDVFFVISDFLITSIILEERETGVFSIAGFYERRARRILPALYVVMLVCIPVAWIWMLPKELENFGQSLLRSRYLLPTFFFGAPAATLTCLRIRSRCYTRGAWAWKSSSI